MSENGLPAMSTTGCPKGGMEEPNKSTSGHRSVSMKMQYMDSADTYSVMGGAARRLTVSGVGHSSSGTARCRSQQEYPRTRMIDAEAGLGPHL